jgi:hypothetical protein
MTNSSSWEKLNPLDLRWSSHGNNHYECVDTAIASGTWSIGVFHQIGIEEGPTLEDFSDLVTYIAAYRDSGELWVDTFREIACYIRERSVATLERSYDTETNAIKIYLRVDLAYPYIVPLTLRTNVGDSVVVSIKQSEMPISYKLINDKTDRVVQYDAVPDGGNVIIELTNQMLEQ